MTVLVTGGAGYIGSHTLVELLNNNYQVVVVDNLCNSSVESLHRVEKITGKSIPFYRGDVLDKSLLVDVMTSHNVISVIHFAGLKAVGESVAKPIKYYQNNVAGSLVLLEAMTEANVFNLVFSSSATVYRESAIQPLKEDFPLGTTNPYGQSKLMVENILEDLSHADKRWNIARLRYFNPVGAHESGMIGEDPNDIPNNLMPFISQVAIGKRNVLSIFGNDYPTVDGTGVRDYIHVVDLADGHVKALAKLAQAPGLITCNLGTGKGVSVLEMLKAYEQASGKEIAHQFVARRAGDIAEYFGDPSLAKELLQWEAKHTLEDIVSSSWKWQSQNPNGYHGS
ncbi:UDP-glucose 4-epimerase GalE [Shewanella avicenniae]|uniref:UDP-glucose 4-epimerase n=1 Tax=Shewanella avicenniae TaxID=2814294 RepID=A0ABX7QNW6_9GAMM|nr:UDP-glucose 4-epimerase GalE [Shewanella avicenniae]QSX32580.1 UDP-glucose 4-epimerase GalE [Shewanella avicenniae]